MAIAGIDEGLVTRAGCRRLLAYRAYLDDPASDFGEEPTVARGVISGTTLAPRAEALVQECYRSHLVQPLDWGTWAHEHRSLLGDPAAVATADLPTLIAIVTTIVRQDRFSDGALLAALRSGMLAAVFARLAVLAPGLPPRRRRSPTSAPDHPGAAHG